MPLLADPDELFVCQRDFSFIFTIVVRGKNPAAVFTAVRRRGRRAAVFRRGAALRRRTKGRFFAAAFRLAGMEDLGILRNYFHLIAK